MKRVLLTTLAATVAVATAALTTTASAETCNNCYVGDMPNESFVGDSMMVGDGSGVGSRVGNYFRSGVSDYMAGCQDRRYGNPDLFYNYFTQGSCNQANAQMYLSPLPVPPNVGHTFYTYQPMYPHHMMYSHTDRFHRYYDNGRGMNRTRAKYYSPPVRQAASNFYWNVLRLPR